MDKKRFPVERLEKFVVSALVSRDFPEEDARLCATRMIEADLRGMHGHGVFRLPGYCRRIREGGYNKNPDIQIQRETPVSALVDGDNGLGQAAASYGQGKTQAQKGEPFPEGWMVDRQGRPLTDPAKVKAGFLLPIGGHKGYGLSLVIGRLAGVLNAAAFGSAVIDFNQDFKTPTNSGQMYFAMKPDLFRDLDDFKAEMDLRIREFRRSTPIKGAGPIRVPGEMALAREKEMRAQGIPVAPQVLKELQEIAGDLNLADRLES